MVPIPECVKGLVFLDILPCGGVLDYNFRTVGFIRVDTPEISEVISWLKIEGLPLLDCHCKYDYFYFSRFYQDLGASIKSRGVCHSISCML
jgi:hypothetical protein